VDRGRTTCRKYLELPRNSNWGRFRDRRWAVTWPSAGRFLTAYGQNVNSWSYLNLAQANCVVWLQSELGGPPLSRSDQLRSDCRGCRKGIGWFGL